LERPSESVIVPLYGKVDYVADRLGEYHPMWTDWQAVIGVPHDMPVVGYGGETVNYLRLYSARGSQDFDMEVFNEGDYISAVEQKVRAETISKVLYPSDAVAEGKELRLIQEYFLVACSTRDLIRRFEQDHDDYELLPQHVAIQLNDTHPALAVAELMRLLVDEKNIAWEIAWRITRDTLAYTNHTLLPEALEKWSVSLVERVLPRHLQIIFEINRRFMDQVEIKWPGDNERKRRMSIIEEGDEQQIRMCNLAIVGSHSVNGVSALHSDLVTTNLVPDFFELWPDHFNNKTNGITQRRWLLQSNPKLSSLITESIGNSWITDLDELRKLETFATDSSFQQNFTKVKAHNKQLLAKIIREQTNLNVDPASMFDVQVKRIHEYKRQLLNILRIVHDFHAITEDGWIPECPRTYIFGGKAAPGYWAAKQFIKLICSISRTVEKNAKASEHMKVVMLPNYRVSLAERIFPASDLSEQVSTAGYEASGTGNMKFALNGALTMGTLDGANVEIREEVGDDNIFIFGLTAAQIQEIQSGAGYNPREYFDRDERIRRVLDSLRTGVFAQRQGDSFEWIADYLLEPGEKYFHLADFEMYLAAQAHASQLYTDKDEWARRAILNVARVGKFSSDRTIREYASEIWNCA
ncbi:MAG: starch phosphorylase, partial [Pirellulaceae bacterium]